MKWVMRFFAVYILSLSLFPCGDREDCTLTAKQQQAITAAHHRSQDEHAENCPPLCTCACCGIHFLHFTSSIKINKPYFFSSPTLSKQDFNLTEIHLPIWQPPQLS